MLAERHVTWFDDQRDSTTSSVGPGARAAGLSRAAAARHRHRSRPSGPRSSSSRSTPRAPTRSAPAPLESRRPASTRSPRAAAAFLQAYATVPETLPSHSSMMTGLYPAGHGVHENARYLAATASASLAERLRQAGYRTAAFVSSFVLARRFGLARGFDRLRRRRCRRAASSARARETTDRALALARRRPSAQPLFLWVHYFDPHAPYAPPEPFRSRYADAAVSRRSRGDGRAARPPRPGVRAARARGAGGDRRRRRSRRGARRSRRGAARQPALSVDDARAAGGGRAGRRGGRRATRRSARAGSFTRCSTGPGSEPTHSLRAPTRRVGGRARRGDEAVPRIRMAAADHGGRRAHKAILRGHDRGLRRRRRSARDAATSAPSANLPARAAQGARRLSGAVAGGRARAASALERRGAPELASLGYVSATRGAGRPQGRAAAGRHGAAVRRSTGVGALRARRVRGGDPAAGADPGRGSAQPRRRAAAGDRALVARPGRARRSRPSGRRAAIAPRLAGRPHLPRAALRARQGVAAGGAAARADRRRDRRIACRRSRRWRVVREQQGRLAEAIALRQKIYGAARRRRAAELVAPRRAGDERAADAARHRGVREGARRCRARRFEHDLELGVLYLAARRFDEARDALDRVPASHPDYPMALFKRAQVSVLLNEPDSAARIARARAARRCDDARADRDASGCFSERQRARR